MVEPEGRVGTAGAKPVTKDAGKRAGRETNLKRRKR